MCALWQQEKVWGSRACRVAGSYCQPQVPQEPGFSTFSQSLHDTHLEAQGLLDPGLAPAPRCDPQHDEPTPETTRNQLSPAAHHGLGRVAMHLHIYAFEVTLFLTAARSPTVPEDPLRLPDHSGSPRACAFDSIALLRSLPSLAAPPLEYLLALQQECGQEWDY